MASARETDKIPSQLLRCSRNQVVGWFAVRYTDFLSFRGSLWECFLNSIHITLSRGKGNKQNKQANKQKHLQGSSSHSVKGKGSRCQTFMLTFLRDIEFTATKPSLLKKDSSWKWHKGKNKSLMALPSRLKQHVRLHHFYWQQFTWRFVDGVASYLLYVKIVD